MEPIQQNILGRDQMFADNNWDCITWELYATTECNLACSYCYNAGKRSRYLTTEYSIPELILFLQKYSRKGDCLSFTGGEPLIRREWIAEVLEKTAVFGFEYEIYTNGMFLHTLTPRILNCFKNIIVSIDGDQRRNDASRGKGAYAKIIENIHMIRPLFTGDIVARITVTSDNHLDESVKSLLESGYFDIIYWQYENTWHLNDFPLEKKLLEIDDLIRFWLENLKQRKMHRLQPFIAITVRLLDQSGDRQYHATRDRLPACTLGCGAGHHYFQIFTTGDLYACPEMVLQPHNRVGNIRTGIERRIGLKDFDNTEKCGTCDEFEICHCRCLHCTPDKYCALIRRAISGIRQELPMIKTLIDDGRIDRRFFHIKEGLEEMF